MPEVTAADLISLADSHDVGDCPEAVLLDAVEDAGAGRWEWRPCRINSDWADLVPPDCPWNTEAQHVLATAFASDEDRWWRLNVPDDREFHRHPHPRRAATAAFVRKVADEVTP